MKRLLFILLFVISGVLNAATYYISPSGNDATGSGAIGSPWFSLNKAWTVVAAGDIVYMRGGTYTITEQWYLEGKNGTAGNLIKVWEYPGETVIVTRGVTFTRNYYKAMIYFSGNYVHFKGQRWTGMQTIPGDLQVDPAFYVRSSNHCIFEQMECDNSVYGMYCEDVCDDLLIKNCDFYNNYDDVRAYGGNSDGLALAYNTSLTTSSTIIGCRAWNNGDDGFDTFETSGYVLIDSCIAWHNGYIRSSNTTTGDGVGFKLGSDFLTTPAGIGVVKRRLQRSIAFDNLNAGAHINEADYSTELYNNTFWRNNITGLNFHWNNQVHYFRNNVSFGNTDKDVEISTASTKSNNSAGTAYNDGGWTTNASTGDFLSTDTTIIRTARQSDGTLPDIDFLKLVSGSDLVNAGIDVGLAYNSTAPDRGAREYGLAGGGGGGGGGGSPASSPVKIKGKRIRIKN